MKQKVIAFTGISGVGKTTFLVELAKLVSFQHLTAGSLISAAREAASNQRDELRCHDIDENQRLLIDGFAETRDPHSALIVIDGHVVIDNGEELAKIPSNVFHALDVNMMVHLKAEPKCIASNRLKDTFRSRPKYSTETLQRHQELSQFHAESIAVNLRVEFQTVTHDDVAFLAAKLKGQN